LLLTQRLGDVGKKIHSGRSRNDQVLVDVKLFIRYQLEDLVGEIRSLFDLLISLGEQHKEKLSSGLHTFAAGDALVFWIMVWSLCLKAW